MVVSCKMSIECCCSLMRLVVHLFIDVVMDLSLLNVAWFVCLFVSMIDYLLVAIIFFCYEKACNLVRQPKVREKESRAYLDIHDEYDTANLA